MKMQSRALERGSVRRAGAGYSGKPLTDKLGIKARMVVALVSAPSDFPATLGPLAAGATITRRLGPNSPMIVAFAASLAVVESRFGRWKRALAPDGALWVCWPKRASSVVSDLNENGIRTVGLAHGLVDVKVCAIDQTWSGLKFVYRLKDRTPQYRR